MKQFVSRLLSLVAVAVFCSMFFSATAEANPYITYHITNIYLDNPGEATIEGYFENEGDDGAYVKSVRLDLTLIDEDGQQMWQDYGIRHSLDLYVPAYEVVDYTFFIQEPGIPGYYGTFDYRWRADINWEEIAG